VDTSSQFDVVEFRRGEPAPKAGGRTVVNEFPLVIRVNREQVYTLMRTPGHDRELTVGFLFTERIIEALSEIHMLRECPDTPNVMDVATANTKQEGGKRETVISSSCGLCGRPDIESLVAGLQPVGGELAVDVSLLYAIPGAVRSAQSLFQSTGGSHAAALFDAGGQLIVLREDVGRHCALDKALGFAYLRGMPMSGYGAFLSGRASLEMIVKIARAGISLVAAASAPTQAAVDTARRLGITLCGFVRGDEVTVYSHAERIRQDGNASYGIHHAG
jgi:FdhD protein